MGELVAFVSLAAGLACLISAIYLLFQDTDASRSVAKAIENAALASAADTKGFAALPPTLESVASIAKALKDLDRVAQLLTVALGFFAIAGVAAGLESIGEGLGGGGQQVAEWAEESR